MATGNTLDILAYLHYQFYDLVYYCDDVEKYSSSKEKLGQWLGPAPSTNDMMTYYIFTQNNQVLACFTIYPANDNTTINCQWQATSHDEGWSNNENLLQTSVSPNIISSDQDITHCAELPTIELDNLVRCKFVREFDGTP